MEETKHTRGPRRGGKWDGGSNWVISLSITCDITAGGGVPRLTMFPPLRSFLLAAQTFSHHRGGGGVSPHSALLCCAHGIFKVLLFPESNNEITRFGGVLVQIQTRCEGNQVHSGKCPYNYSKLKLFLHSCRATWSRSCSPGGRPEKQ